MNDKKALVIFGSRGGGKTTRAIQEAKKIGTFSMINIQTVFSPFEFGAIFDKNPDVIIVDDCLLETLSDPKIKLIVSEEKLLIEKRGKEPRLVKNVQWIFTVCIDRRFFVITV